VKAVFLDYETVSGGDLDTSAMARAVGTLELCDWDVARTAERMRDADIVLVNKIQLTRVVSSASGFATCAATARRPSCSTRGR
jgi:hypothetical protein